MRAGVELKARAYTTEMVFYECELPGVGVSKLSCDTLFASHGCFSVPFVSFFDFFFFMFWKIFRGLLCAKRPPPMARASASDYFVK